MIVCWWQVVEVALMASILTWRRVGMEDILLEHRVLLHTLAGQVEVVQPLRHLEKYFHIVILPVVLELVVRAAVRTVQAEELGITEALVLMRVQAVADRATSHPASLCCHMGLLVCPDMAMAPSHGMWRQRKHPPIIPLSRHRASQHSLQQHYRHP